MHNRDGNTHVHNEGSDLLNEERLIRGIKKILDEEKQSGSGIKNRPPFANRPSSPDLNRVLIHRKCAGP